MNLTARRKPKMAKMALPPLSRSSITIKHGGTLIIDPVRGAGLSPRCATCDAPATIYALVIPAAQAVALLADWDVLSAQAAETGAPLCHEHMRAVVDLWAADVETVQ